MRDPDRITQFLFQIENGWKECCPDWRFGQLMLNFLGWVYENKRDPFFIEEDEMIEYFNEYLGEICPKSRKSAQRSDILQ